MTRKVKGTYHKNVINENLLYPRTFWNSVKEIFPTKIGTKNSKTKSPVGKLKSSSLKLKEFVCKCPRKVSLRTNETFEFGYVSKVFIGIFLKNMKRNKSTDTVLDELPPGC